MEEEQKANRERGPGAKNSSLAEQEQVLKSRSFIGLSQLRQARKVSDGVVGIDQDRNTLDMHMELDLAGRGSEKNSNSEIA